MKKRLLKIFRMFLILNKIKFFELVIKNLFNINYKITYLGNTLNFRKKSSDFEVFYQIFIRKDYYFDEIIKLNPKVIIDAGCNNGFSIANFKNTFKNSLVIGIEPEKNNYNYAVMNTQNFSNVFIEQKALWYEKTEMVLNDTFEGEYAYSITRNGDKNSLVQTITIDEIIKIYNLDSIDLIKIDIEGAEKDLFNAENTKWLQKVKYMIIEFHDWIEPGCSQALFKALREYSFSVGVRGENFIIKFHHE